MAIKAKITDDGRFIQLVDYTTSEIDQIRLSFKKRISNWRFHPLVKKKVWDGYITFIDRYNRLPIGLWHKLIEQTKKYNFELELENKECLVNTQINKEEFVTWVKELLKNKTNLEIRDYQLESIYKILRYYKSRSELSTNAGKTLMVFLVYAYLKKIGILNKMLIIVPNTQLIIQAHDDFLDYAKDTELEGTLNIQMIYATTKKQKIKEDTDILIGTFQSLNKRDESFFEGVNVTCVDECHHTVAKSVKEIITKSYDSLYRFGLSGTLKNDECAESYTLDAYLGPTIQQLSSDYLIKSGYATKIFIKGIKLNYIDDDIRQKLYQLRVSKSIDGSKALDTERKVVIENQKRLNFIIDIIKKTTKNSLVLFLDVKNNYGRNIYNILKEETDKIVYYVDGGTDTKYRDQCKKNMELGDDKIMVASFGTFAQGISINNIHHLFFAESYKSDRLVRQSIGRGMRVAENKDKFIVWDFIDDFSWQRGNNKWKKDNYLLKHGKERQNIYNQQKFPYKTYTINL